MLSVSLTPKASLFQDCGLGGCAEFATPVQCTNDCAAAFEEFMARCHEHLPAEQADGLNAFLQQCQEQNGYTLQSQERGGH